MELHNNEVPDFTVYAVTIDGPFGQALDWYITPSASSDAFRDSKEASKKASSWKTVARWKVELPKRGWDADDVAPYAAMAISRGNATRLDVFTNGVSPEDTWKV